MKIFTLTFVLLAAFAVVALAEPEPEPVKASRYRAAQIIEDDVKDADDHDQLENDEVVVNDASKKGDASSGRLFMKKFVLFKNMFGQNQKQPIIPIIITGANSDDGIGLSPTTTTITSDGTIPTATGTITTETLSPTGAGAGPEPGAGAGAGNEGEAVNRIHLYGRGSSSDNDKEAEEEGAIVDEHTLAAALAAGAEEYVVTDQEIQGTSDAKANNGPARINLRRRGTKRGQVVSVRVPARYRGYFKNGQRVILNNNKRTRPVKRRVIKRRTNRRRLNKNKNKRRRIVVA
ncbi:uncharacterized protein LOC119606305 [Lucilia sericata]|uniref:uncharacterized protein LOC119606305 n=1 Tax=Lucilia sericata TaxID=13632 RepID=UPI0018A81F99|nr:uncharacterized protein LOC119606305 [Lucilia sericata]